MTAGQGWILSQTGKSRAGVGVAQPAGSLGLLAAPHPPGR